MRETVLSSLLATQRSVSVTARPPGLAAVWEGVIDLAAGGGDFVNSVVAAVRHIDGVIGGRHAAGVGADSDIADDRRLCPG